jgi:predicted phosphodiesterase
MRIGIISDIHGNLIALDNVLARLKRERVDQIICLGDVAFGGPQPNETVERLRELGCSCVMGNTDDFFVHAPKPDPDYENEMRFREMMGWMTAQLSADSLDYIRSFRPQVEFPLEYSDSLLCYHGSPNSLSGTIFPTTPDDELAEMLGNCRASVMAGGHTHMQMLRRFASAILLNPGSVGMPFVRGATRDMDYRPPWSEYAILTWTKENIRVELLRVPLDVNAVIAQARKSGLPFAARWASVWRD